MSKPFKDTSRDWIEDIQKEMKDKGLLPSDSVERYSIQIKTDLDTYNLNASSWLESLILTNYGINVDLKDFKLLDSDYIGKIDFTSNSPEVLYRNIIFLINGLNEYYENDADQYGRFPAKASILVKKDILKTNVVHHMLVKFLAHLGIKIEVKPSKMLISHDIDTLHDGRIYELKKAITTQDFPLFRRILSSFISGKTNWKNLDEIKSLVKGKGYQSTFYFLTESGHAFDIKNADYKISDDYVLNFIQNAIADGFEIGLHKSTMSTSIDDEFSKIPFHNGSNRHHYLRYRIPALYRNLSQSVAKTDSSLCFPYDMGFRNGYGMPFRPFDLEYGQTLNIVEIPFQMMDRMFDTNTEDETKLSYKEISTFIKENSSNAVLGMLWHNTELSEVAHPHSKKMFSNILDDLSDYNIDVVRPQDILSEFAQKWKT